MGSCANIHISAVWIAFLVLLAVPRVDSFSSAQETSLRASLFTGYDHEVRPTDVTDVSLKFSPTSLNSIDIKSATMQITGWWTLTWNDSRLTWNPASYGGIEETHVFQQEVWTPSVIVYNSVDNLSAITENTIPLRITSAGTIIWSPPGILTVSCSTDITYFPFDTQTCGIMITTFGYTIQEVRVSPGDIDTTFYSPNGEWVLEDMYTESKPALYSFVSYQFVYERKPDYYGLNLMMPVIMCWLLSVFIFLLPAESGEKMGYSLTVLLAFVVLMTLLADTMPTTADHVSFLEVYIIMVLAFCGLSVGYSIISLAIYFHTESEVVPAWLTRFTVWVQQRSCRRTAKVTSVSRQETDDLPRKNEWTDAPAPSPGGSDATVTWKEAALALDSVVLKVYVSTTSLLTVIFLAVMGLNS